MFFFLNQDNLKNPLKIQNQIKKETKKIDLSKPKVV